jgi:hypothetical protein
LITAPPTRTRSIVRPARSAPHDDWHQGHQQQFSRFRINPAIPTRDG